MALLEAATGRVAAPVFPLLRGTNATPNERDEAPHRLVRGLVV